MHRSASRDGWIAIISRGKQALLAVRLQLMHRALFWHIDDHLRTVFDAAESSIQAALPQG